MVEREKQCRGRAASFPDRTELWYEPCCEVFLLTKFIIDKIGAEYYILLLIT